MLKEGGAYTEYRSMYVCGRRDNGDLIDSGDYCGTRGSFFFLSLSLVPQLLRTHHHTRLTYLFHNTGGGEKNAWLVYSSRCVDFWGWTRPNQPDG